MSASEDTPREKEQVTRWVSMAGKRKCIFGWPDWQLRSPRQSKVGEVPNATDQFTLSVLLGDDAGSTIEGLELRIVVWRDRPMEDATALLRIEEDGWLTIARLDCWPPSPHENLYWRLLGQPAQVVGSHVHRCEDNARLGRRAFKPFGNLPSAVGVDSEPQSFRDMMRLVELHFCVDGASGLPAPDWQGRLIS